MKGAHWERPSCQSLIPVNCPAPMRPGFFHGLLSAPRKVDVASITALKLLTVPKLPRITVLVGRGESPAPGAPASTAGGATRSLLFRPTPRVRRGIAETDQTARPMNEGIAPRTHQPRNHEPLIQTDHKRKSRMTASPRDAIAAFKRRKLKHSRPAPSGGCQLFTWCCRLTGLALACEGRCYSEG